VEYSKKKVAIITLSREFNHGAFLQSYNLKRFIEDKYGYEVFFVDVFNKYFHLKKAILVTLRERSFFASGFLKILTYIKLQKKLNYINLKDFTKDIHKFDYLVFGSDEIWNLSLNKNFLFFGGSFIYKDYQKIISYAASFGSTSYLKPDIKKELIQRLSKFHFISARDVNTQKILKEELNFDSNLVVDPTLLNYKYDKELLNKNTYSHPKKYLLVYGVKFDNDILKDILYFSKKYNLEIVTMVYSHKFAHINLVNVDINDFINLIIGSKIFFTNMFHGTLYAVKYSSNFCFNYSSYRKNKFSHISNIFELNSNKHSLNKKNIIEYKNKSKKFMSVISKTSMKFIQNCFK